MRASKIRKIFLDTREKSYLARLPLLPIFLMQFLQGRWTVLRFPSVYSLNINVTNDFKKQSEGASLSFENLETNSVRIICVNETLQNYRNFRNINNFDFGLFTSHFMCITYRSAKLRFSSSLVSRVE
jgi:hypothetical protein